MIICRPKDELLNTCSMDQLPSYHPTDQLLTTMNSVDSGFGEMVFKEKQEETLEKKKIIKPGNERKSCKSTKKISSFSQFSFESAEMLCTPEKFESTLLTKEYHGYTLETILAKTQLITTIKAKQLENIKIDKTLQRVKTMKNLKIWRTQYRAEKGELERKMQAGEDINYILLSPLGTDPDWNIQKGNVHEKGSNSRYIFLKTFLCFRIPRGKLEQKNSELPISFKGTTIFV